MIIAIASGKGGTGKTTFSIALALSSDEPVCLLDCDVEEPNSHLFINCSEKLSEQVTVLKPVINKEKCSGCGLCAKICQYNSIAVVSGKAMVFSDLCHSCGGCTLVCPEAAIVEKPVPIGTFSGYDCGKVSLYSGELNIGQAMSPPLIRKVKESIDKTKFNIIDCPPGTSCPMITAVRDADYVVLITEPTPFGLHDMKLAAATLKKLNLSFGVVINRCDSGDSRVEDYCINEKIKVIMKIPDDINVAKAYSTGGTILDAGEQYRELFKKFYTELNLPVNGGLQ